MTEALDLAEETTPSGFRRYKSRYDTIHRPWWIYEWIAGEDQDDAMPPSVKKALTRLDGHASELVATDRRRMRSRKPFLLDRDPQSDNLDGLFEDLFRLTFGLDQDHPVMQLRMAVARAWLMSWRYAELWQTRKEHIRTLKQLMDPTRVESIIASTEEYVQLVRAIDHIEYADHDDWVACAEAIWLQSSYLRQRVLQLDADRLLKDLTLQKPENFFIIKLSEIYAFSFGRGIPFHDSNKHTVRGTSPDRQLAEFIEPILQIVGYPKPETSRDRNFREIRSQSVPCFFKALANTKYPIPRHKLHQYAKAKRTAQTLEDFDFYASYDQLNSAIWLSEYGLTLDEQSMLYTSYPA